MPKSLAKGNGQIHVMFLKSSTWVSRISPARVLADTSWRLSCRAVGSGLPEDTVDRERCYRIVGSNLVKTRPRDQRSTVWKLRIDNESKGTAARMELSKEPRL